MDLDPQLFCLRWNNHQSNLLSVFDQLLQVEAFCDVTLAVEGATVKCHKMILAASSVYFQSIFMENTCKHPIVFLKDIKFNQMKALLDYMYHGEVSIEEEELSGLLKVAEALKVKGLVEIDEEGSATPKQIVYPTRPLRDRLSTASSASSTEPGRHLQRNGGGVILRSPDHLLAANSQNPTPHNIMVPTTSATQSASPLTSLNSKIWPTSPAKLMGPARTEEKEGEDHILIIDEESIQSNESSSNLVDNDYYGSDDTPPAPGMIRTMGANGKLEWKRYKQYTKDDILAAIEEVKNGMSALQASRKYGVPSRTLYDKVKKMGILTANMQKQIQQKRPASTGGTTPQINLLGMQLPQANLPTAPAPAVKTAAAKTAGAATEAADNSLDKLEKTGPIAPLSGALMLSMIERLKSGNPLPQDGNLPLNLTTILSQTREEGGSGSDSGHSSSETDGVKEEKNELDIRAQFFAELKKNHQGLEKVTETTGLVAKEERPEAEAKAELTNGSHHSNPSSPPVTLIPGGGTQHSVTLQPREESALAPGGSSRRKRKLSNSSSAPGGEDSKLESQVNSDCKKAAVLPATGGQEDREVKEEAATTTTTC